MLYKLLNIGTVALAGILYCYGKSLDKKAKQRDEKFKTAIKNAEDSEDAKNGDGFNVT